MIKVAIESPFAGDVKTNLKYARACMKDCLLRGEAPYASHLLYTQEGILDDDVPEERTLGMEAGKLWELTATKTVVYTDRGMSNGMKWGIEKAKAAGRLLEYRQLGGQWETPAGLELKSLSDDLPLVGEEYWREKYIILEAACLKNGNQLTWLDCNSGEVNNEFLIFENLKAAQLEKSIKELSEKINDSLGGCGRYNV